MKTLKFFLASIANKDQTKHPLLFGNFNTLTGLRGLCMLWVMFVHLPSYAVPGFLAGIHNHWRFGVDFFLAISGLLVTRSLYQCHAIALSKGKPLGFAIKEYMIRRVSRIFPPYYFTLAMLFGLALITKNNFYAQLKEVSSALPSFPLFFANYTIPGVIERLPHTFIILWSVSFQEQFYFLLALMFIVSPGRLRHMLFAAGVFSILARFACVFWFWKGIESNNQFETWLHLNFDALAWGCLAWIAYDELGALWATKTRSIISSTLISVGTLTTIMAPTWWDSSLHYAIIAIFKAPLIALTVRMVCELENSKGLAASLLRGRWLGKLGLVSYEVYLLHVLLYGFISKAIPNNGPLFLAVAYPTAITLGYFYYHQFGKPAQEWAKHILRRVPIYSNRASVTTQAIK